jgi:hypothetical protein
MIMSSSDNLRGRAERLRQASLNLPIRRTATAPVENGIRVATIERTMDEQMRVNWSECEGHSFVQIRIWNRDRSGQWWPDVKRGLSVRIRELPSFAAAIADCLDLLEADRQRRQENQANRPVPPRETTPIAGRRTYPLPLQAREPGEFDEFAMGNDS